MLQRKQLLIYQPHSSKIKHHGLITNFYNQIGISVSDIISDHLLSKVL